MPHQSSKKKYHYYQSATSYLVVDTGHSNTYCHAFAADSDTALFESFPHWFMPKMLQFCLLCRLHIHSSLPSQPHDASSTAAGKMLFSLDSLLKTQDRSDTGDVFSTGRSNPGSDLRSEQRFPHDLWQELQGKWEKMRQFNSNRYDDSVDIIVAFIVVLTSTNIGMAVVVV